MNGQTYRLSVEIESSGAENKVSGLKTKLTELTVTSKQLDDAFKKNSQSANLYQQAISKVDGVSGKIKQTLDRLKTTAKGAGDGVEQAGKDIKQAGNDAQDAQSKFDGLGQAFGRLKGLMLAGLAMAGVGSVVQTADAMKTLDGQIKIATGSAEKHAIAMSEIERIAMANNVSLSSVGEMYVSNERALKQLGKSQSEVLKFTENVTQAMRLGGGSAEGQAAALTQLGQALASGVLRGDEFNSIAEQAPAIMDLLSQSLGVTTGELRKMAGDGKLTADVLYKAMTDAKATDKLQSMASQTSTTVQGALENVRTQWDLAVHAIMNSKGGVSDIIANGILLVANGLQKVGDYLPIVNQYISDVISKGKELWDSFSNSEFGQASFDVLKSAFETTGTAIDTVVTAFQTVYDWIVKNQEVSIPLGAALGVIGTALALPTVASYALAVGMGILTTVTTVATTVMGAFASVLAFVTSPIGLIIVGIAALVAIGVALYRNWDTIKAKASEVWNGIKQWASDVWHSIVGIWGSLGEWFSNIWSNIKTSFSEWLSSMPAPVQEMVENIGSIFDGLVAIASTIWNGLVTVVKWVVDGIVAIWQGFISVISSIWAVIVNVAKTVWNAIVTVVTTVINAIKVVISGVVTVFSLAWQGLVNIATSVWNAIKAVVSLGINNIKAIFTAGVTIFASIFNAGFNAVKTVVSTVFNVIKSLVKGDMEGVKQAFSDGFNKLKSIATKAKDNIVNALKDLGSKLLSAGRDAVQGFINGFTSKMEDAYNKAREMASKVISVVKSALDIHSPSREMKKLGKHTAEGMQVGIDEGKDKAVKAAKKMADDIKKTVADSVANLKREIALFGNDSPVDALAYDIKIGKYKGADTKELEALTMQKYTLERNKVVLDEIDSIKEKIALVGKSELETLKYQLDHADKYKGISDEIKQSYLERTEALNQAIKAQERLSKVEAATADIAKNKHILANWQDKHAGLKYDLGKDGYDASQIEQIVQAEVVKEQVGKLQQLFSDISNKQVFATPQITANLANKGGGFDFASQMFGQSFDIAKKFEEQNALLKAAREQGLIDEEVYLKQSEALTQAHVEAKAALMQSATQSVLGGITGIMKNVYGEQSKHYKVAFAMEKAYSVATILMKQKEALAKAWASAPFPANLGAVASTMASTGALAATVNAIRPVGQAHDGIMSVPKSGTWNLEKGERVLPKHTAKALDDKLANMNGAGNNVVITINIDNKGNEQQSSENAGQQAKTLANTIKAVVYETLRSERRQGGLLA